MRLCAQECSPLRCAVNLKLYSKECSPRWFASNCKAMCSGFSSTPHVRAKYLGVFPQQCTPYLKDSVLRSARIHHYVPHRGPSAQRPAQLSSPKGVIRESGAETQTKLENILEPRTRQHSKLQGHATGWQTSAAAGSPDCKWILDIIS